MSTVSRPPRSSETAIEERFRRLAVDWKEQSQYLSNTAQMAMLKPYQRIIGIGLPAVPLILEELQREPDQWFWALESITEENPVPPEADGKVRLMAQAWIEWGQQRDYIAQ
jgi:hypothetical protein